MDTLFIGCVDLLVLGDDLEVGLQFIVSFYPTSAQYTKTRFA